MNQPKSSALEQRLARLYSRINYERQSRVTPKSFKLANMRELLKRLDDPHLKYPVIHVAGTKGKGSVTTMIGSILSNAGLKTGVYTSPHLETIHQRIAVNGQLITDEQLIDVLDEIQPVLEQMDREAVADNRRDLTFFEVTTAATFFHFARQQVDAAVVEVGLGGRLDSTNVCHPAICVITNISYDHTKQLGNTLDAIAREKAGIIKDQIPVISGAVNPDAAAVIAEVANQRHAPLFVLDRDFNVAIQDTHPVSSNNSTGVNGPGSQFDWQGTIGETSLELADLQLGLLGSHQITNAALAIAATVMFRQQGPSICDDSIRRGLENVHLTGRTELIGNSPLVIVDMAHNVASVAALIDSLTTELPQWKTAKARKLILATSREKDALGMIRLLIRHFDEIVFTQYLNNPRSKPPSELMEIGIRLRDQMNLPTKITIDDDPTNAWRSMSERSEPDDVICISGSAFLVAELRQKVLDSATQTAN